MNSPIVATLFSLVSIISPLFIFITSAYYLGKKARIDSVLLFIGSGLGLLITVFYTFIMPSLISNNNLPLNSTTQIYTIVGVINFFSGILFATGFFILVYHNVTKQNNTPNQFPLSKD